jgi:hypothetical protein
MPLSATVPLSKLLVISRSWSMRGKKVCSFLKKRTKKLLILRRSRLSGHGRDLYACAELKVFWFRAGFRLFFNAQQQPFA